LQVDIPAFQWPIAKYPRYKYPLAENKAYNDAQDKECLEDVELKIKEQKEKVSSDLQRKANFFPFFRVTMSPSSSPSQFNPKVVTSIAVPSSLKAFETSRRKTASSSSSTKFRPVEVPLVTSGVTLTGICPHLPTS
jgi:hypothetical protein